MSLRTLCLSGFVAREKLHRMRPERVFHPPCSYRAIESPKLKGTPKKPCFFIFNAQKYFGQSFQNLLSIRDCSPRKTAPNEIRENFSSPLSYRARGSPMVKDALKMALFLAPTDKKNMGLSWSILV